MINYSLKYSYRSLIPFFSFSTTQLCFFRKHIFLQQDFFCNKKVLRKYTNFKTSSFYLLGLLNLNFLLFLAIRRLYFYFFSIVGELDQQQNKTTLRKLCLFMMAVGLASKHTNTKRFDSVINITAKILLLPWGFILWQKQKKGRKVHCLPQTTGQIPNFHFFC